MSTLNPKIPIAFSAPAQKNLYQTYGDPREKGWEEQWMTRWNIAADHSWFPKEVLYLHRDFKPLLQEAFRELELQGFHQEIKTCDGCFNIRHVRGSYSVLSVHSWGAAIDLNARDNPLGSQGRWSSDLLAIMSQSGLYCGQLWTGRKDPMHFSMVNG